MRLMVLTVMGITAGLGLAVAIVSVPVMAEKGPLRDTLVADLGGAQKEAQGGGGHDGRGRAMVKVFKEQLCARIVTDGIESSSSKATIHLGMSGEVGPTVANLEEERAATPTTDTTGTTTGTTTDTTTGTTTGTTGTTTGTTGTTTGTTGTTGTTTPTTGTTTGTTGAQIGTTTTTTSGDSTSPLDTTQQSTTAVGQTSLSQSTASPTASASASALAASTSTASSTSRATTVEQTGGCVEVPRALSLELLEHPGRFYVSVTNEQSPEGAIRGQLHRGGNSDHRSKDADHRSGDDKHRSGDANDD